jgi:hypothetical protein
MVKENYLNENVSFFISFLKWKKEKEIVGFGYSV